MKARRTQPVARLRAAPFIVGTVLCTAGMAWTYVSLLDIIGSRAGHPVASSERTFRVHKGLDGPRFRHTGEGLLYRDIHQSRGFLEDALVQDPHNAALWLRLAQSYFYAGDPARGSRIALHSLNLAPAYAPIHLEQAAMVADFWSSVDTVTQERWNLMVVELYAQQPKRLAEYLYSSGKLWAACSHIPALQITLLCPQSQNGPRS